MSKVAVIRCDSYNYGDVKAAVEKGVELLGGAGIFAKPGEKILLKPNMVTADSPEKCITTHFTIVKAAAELFIDAGAKVTYGDSPAIQSPEAAARKSQIAGAAEEAGAVLADFRNGEEVFFKEGIQNKKFFIAKGALDCDGIISLPKLKTHGLARITGCIKNQFGCIPGPLKGEFHARIPNVLDFAQMLVDLNCLLKPRLYILDGIYAMEGNGPRSGTPKKMNVLMFSADPVALDSVICTMIGLNPEYVPTITAGMKSGMGTYLKEQIELVGEPIENFHVHDFNVVREQVKPYKPRGIFNIVRNTLVPKPFITGKKCVKCGVCVNVCPVKPKALDWHDTKKDKPPTYMYGRCIRCYCCQELCPEGAIELKVPLMRRIFFNKK